MVNSQSMDCFAIRGFMMNLNGDCVVHAEQEMKVFVNASLPYNVLVYKTMKVSSKYSHSALLLNYFPSQYDNQLRFRRI